MNRCPHCRSFVPARVCPECGHHIVASKALASLQKAAMGGLTAVTLMACYGAAYAPEADYPTAVDPCPDPSADLDGDGYCGEADCDEQNADVQCPGPAETEEGGELPQ